MYRSAAEEDRPRGPPGAGRRDRRRGGPGSSRVASGRGRRGARRGGGRRAGAFGRPGAGSRRARRGGGVPSARRRADNRPGAAVGSRAGRGAGEFAGRRIRRGSCAAGRRSRSARRVSARPRRLAAGPRRLRISCRHRCSRAAAGGGEAARAVRLGARAGDLPDRLGRRDKPPRLSRKGVSLEICRAVRALPPPPGAPRSLDLLLDGLALLTTAGHAAAIPTLRRAAKALADIPAKDVLRWGWAAPRHAACGTSRVCLRSPQERSGSSATLARFRRCRAPSPLGIASAWKATSRVPPRSFRRPRAWQRRPGVATRPTPC